MNKIKAGLHTLVVYVCLVSIAYVLAMLFSTEQLSPFGMLILTLGGLCAFIEGYNSTSKGE